MSIQFKVTFTVPESELTTVKDVWNRRDTNYIIVREEYGLDIIDAVRNDLGLEELPLSVFSDKIDALEYAPYLVVDEQDARQVCHFKTSNEITVTMSLEKLRSYLRVDWNVDRKKDGGVTRVRLHWVLKDNILSEWIKNECPLEWNDDAESNDEVNE